MQRRFSRKDFIKLGLGTAAALRSSSSIGAAGKKRRTFHHGDGHALHRWHCKHFFNFDLALNSSEKHYVNLCLDLMDQWAHSLTPHISLSTMSYSHRIHGNWRNASRMAHGSLKHRDKLQEAADKVIHSHKLPTRDIPDREQLAGLGWDYLTGHFKLYFFFEDFDKIRDQEFTRLIPSSSHNNFGIASTTFQQTQIVEKKIYLTSRSPKPLNETLMITSKRGTIHQVDINPIRFDTSTLNPIGQKILAKNLKAGWPLDTIAQHGEEHYTLYF